MRTSGRNNVFANPDTRSAWVHRRKALERSRMPETVTPAVGGAATTPVLATPVHDNGGWQLVKGKRRQKESANTGPPGSGSGARAVHARNEQAMPCRQGQGVKRYNGARNVPAENVRRDARCASPPTGLGGQTRTNGHQGPARPVPGGDMRKAPPQNVRANARRPSTPTAPGGETRAGLRRGPGPPVPGVYNGGNIRRGAAPPPAPGHKRGVQIRPAPSGQKMVDRGKTPARFTAMHPPG
jgi:hypothetical protein